MSLHILFEYTYNSYGWHIHFQNPNLKCHLSPDVKTVYQCATSYVFNENLVFLSHSVYSIIKLYYLNVFCTKLTQYHPEIRPRNDILKKNWFSSRRNYRGHYFNYSCEKATSGVRFVVKRKRNFGSFQLTYEWHLFRWTRLVTYMYVNSENVYGLGRSQRSIICIAKSDLLWESGVFTYSGHMWSTSVRCQRF